ncbi:MAG: cation transporter [Deltaproteobacteria bacterium]|nr:cation transporter [Deltaproteobacteria bacterium]
MSHPLYNKALFLSYFTVGYNIIEGIVSVFFGNQANSIALFGFGLDSFTESFSGAVMIWRFSTFQKISEEKENLIERKAQVLIGISFLLLAFYIGYDSIRKLYFREAPEATLIGIIIAVLSILIMPFLFMAKKKVAEELHSQSFAADSKQTLICSMLSVSLLAGLGLNYMLGWWWMDPIAGLLFVIILIREGHETLQSGKLCC